MFFKHRTNSLKNSMLLIAAYLTLAISLHTHQKAGLVLFKQVRHFI